MKTFLDQILEDVRQEISMARSRRSVADLRAMISDAPPPRDFHGALSGEFGLIAEIKKRSPSVGPMRKENVAAAVEAYEESSIVRAVSILTNAQHFGMSIDNLPVLRARGTKPVIRKDFMIEEYQVREARAFGADAILLMANALDASRLSGFYDLARELGMEALFEVHTLEEIELLPASARIAGINSRKFKAQSGFVGEGGSSEKDFSLDYKAFDLVDKLPAEAIKVAESGLSPKNIGPLSERFDAALIGTSLLRDTRGIQAGLEEFSEALQAA